MNPSAPGATAEWRSHGALPFAAMFGYSVSVIHIYGINPYIIPVTAEFGWTRAQFTGAFTLAILIQALLAVPVGMLVDRFGSRKLGLAGVVMVCLAFTTLGTADGNLNNWYLLWGIITLVALPVQATVWTSAVATCVCAWPTWGVTPAWPRCRVPTWCIASAFAWARRP